jgi:hypothetical protein
MSRVTPANEGQALPLRHNGVDILRRAANQTFTEDGASAAGIRLRAMATNWTISPTSTLYALPRGISVILAMSLDIRGFEILKSMSNTPR